MNEFKLSTAIAFFIFRRPECTIRSFREIAKAKPEKLFIIGDGPRTFLEKQDVIATRDIVKSIDWDCEVLRNYSEENMGCGQRIVSGLEWVFSYVDEAIIIEDDIVPSVSFFRYCQEMLDYHRSNESVFSISGCNIGFASKGTGSTYSYSNFMNMWGWATWKRAFEKIDFSIEFWPSYKESVHLKNRLNNNPTWINFWKSTLDQVYQGHLDTWDYQWIISQLFNSAYSTFPTTNMIENIGCDPQATHTVDSDFIAGKLQRREIAFPIKHPDLFEPNKAYEDYIKTAWCGLKAESKRKRLKDLLLKGLRKLF